MNAFLIIKLFPSLLMVVGYFNKNKDIKHQSKNTSLTSQKKKEKKEKEKKKTSLGNINTILER